MPSVLVVDDNAENRALARETLSDEGYDVVLANDGEAALQAVAASRPDCILMDVRMPKLDGIAACRAIRALPGGGEVAVIFLTAQRDVETFDRAVAAGGDDFLTKPYRPDELVLRVQTAMRLRKLASERGAIVEELKQQRDRLQRLELQKEQLVAFLVHDLKNPVHAIDLLARGVVRGAEDPERVRTTAARIQDESRSLLRMITNLLDISRADEGHLAPAVQRVELASLVEQIREELAPSASGANVTIEVAIGATHAMFDPDLASRLLANLVDNAIRHAPEESAIRISTVAVDGGVEIRVADAGTGVPAEHRAAVFERFQRAGAQPSRSNRGLGLAFCKVAVEAHRGSIWIEDGSPGAVFCVRFPDEN